ncbi:MAG: hypothetical protein E7564_10645 [Ruminococcaceae bacterium]|nr:hypothetical protein [Oscillospiraceae bacterium]
MSDVKTFEISESVVIKIPGISKSKRFLHISDAHIVNVNSESSEEEKIAVSESIIRWNDNGTPALDVFCEFIKFAKEQNPDAVLMAGDIIDYYTEDNVKKLKDLLSSFPCEYLYVMGNHEHGTYGLEIPEFEIMRSNIAPMMRNEAEFYVRDFEEFVIVCIDNSSFDITENQLDKMKAVINEKKPIILLMHIPVWTEEFSKTAWSMLDRDENTTENARLFSELIRSEESGVAAIIAGHEHFAWSGEFAEGRMQYVSAPLFKRFIREINVMPL